MIAIEGKRSLTKPKLSVIREIHSPEKLPLACSVITIHMWTIPKQMKPYVFYVIWTIFVRHSVNNVLNFITVFNDTGDICYIHRYTVPLPFMTFHVVPICWRICQCPRQQMLTIIPQQKHRHFHLLAFSRINRNPVTLWHWPKP